MNYCALDEALCFIETGSYNSDFIIKDMFTNITSLTESVDVLNEADAPKTINGFKGFINKILEALKKAVAAIGKFFAGAWQKFKKFIRSWHDALVGVNTDISKLRVKNKEFDKFMSTAQYNMTDNFRDITNKVFAQIEHLTQNPEEYNANSFKEFVDKVFSDHTKKVNPNECIQIYNRAEGKYFVDMISKKTEKLRKDEEEYKRNIKTLESGANDLSAKYNELNKKLGPNYTNADLSKDLFDSFNKMMKSSKPITLGGGKDKDYYTKSLRKTSIELYTLATVMNKIVSAITSNGSSYNSMMNEMKKYTRRAEEYSNARGSVKYNEPKRNELKTNEVKTNDSPKPFKPESFEYDKFEPKKFEYDKFEI